MIIIFILRGLNNLLFDLSGCAFGFLQFLHQFRVSQKISRSRRQPREEVIFQGFQSDLEAVLLLCEVRLKKKSIIKQQRQKRKRLNH